MWQTVASRRPAERKPVSSALARGPDSALFVATQGPQSDGRNVGLEGEGRGVAFQATPRCREILWKGSNRRLGEDLKDNELSQFLK